MFPSTPPHLVGMKFLCSPVQYYNRKIYAKTRYNFIFNNNNNKFMRNLLSKCFLLATIENIFLIVIGGGRAIPLIT